MCAQAGDYPRALTLKEVFSDQRQKVMTFDGCETNAPELN